MLPKIDPFFALLDDGHAAFLLRLLLVNIDPLSLTLLESTHPIVVLAFLDRCPENNHAVTLGFSTSGFPPGLFSRLLLIFMEHIVTISFSFCYITNIRFFPGVLYIKSHYYFWRPLLKYHAWHSISNSAMYSVDRASERAIETFRVLLFFPASSSVALIRSVADNANAARSLHTCCCRPSNAQVSRHRGVQAGIDQWDIFGTIRQSLKIPRNCPILGDYFWFFGHLLCHFPLL